MSAVPSLESLRGAGVLREVDVHFARAAARLAGVDDPLVLLGLAVASRAPGAGHVCAELRDPSRLVRTEDERGGARVSWPEPGPWVRALRASPVVRDASVVVPRTPLVLDGEHLYLDRYWRYQERLVASLRERAAVVRDDVDEALLAKGLDRMFRPLDDGVPDRQREAAELAVRRGLAIVTGGPGTGKTTTVLRVLALLQEQAVARGGEPLRIALAAPTGKAAARMAEAIRRGLASLPVVEAVRDAIPTAAMTVHRLLGWRPQTPTTFRHGPDAPLAADVVVVDEVSMVDLALMTKLLRAVRDDARVVLLGDRDQLASVEAGAILGDVCPEEPGEGPVAPCIVRLVTSHRFRADGGLGSLARAMRSGDAPAALEVLAAGGEAELVGLDAAGPDLAGVRERVLDGHRALLGATDPEAALDALDRFRILCAHREGPLGAAGVNETVARWCERAGLLDRRQGGGRDGGDAGWYHRRPIIVTENDYALELFNGDTGVILVGDDGRPRAWFRSADGRGVRSVAPARLPRHDTVFAMTVHRAQGSEFERVLLVLPARPSPVLTRELLYTGVTRAREQVTLVGDTAVLAAGIAERVQRASGLRAKLWGASADTTRADVLTGDPAR